MGESVIPDIIARLTRELDDVDDSPQMIFMDFAGQRMYYLMHHVFISAELSVYIVVFSLAEPLDAPLAEEDSGSGMTQLEKYADPKALATALRKSLRPEDGKDKPDKPGRTRYRSQGELLVN